MKKIDYQNVKGTQDFLPSEEYIRRDIRRAIEDIFIQYGYKPLETPILNYTELLASKYGGGAEILQEMYRLRDRGKREIALRYDLTIPFTKVMAMNPTIRKPFKRYEIGKVFRDGPIKAGRFREFTQCDVDIVGVETQIAEAELLVMALDAFRKIGLDVIIQFNNRKLLTGMLEVFNIEKDQINKVVLILDKLEKVGLEMVISEICELNLSISTVESIKQFLIDNNNTSYNYFEQFAKENKQVKEGLEELRELNSYLDYLGVERHCIFNPFLARGLDIYTGTIYEVFLTDESIKSSVSSGGRYDNAIGGLIGTKEKYSTVGISFGLEVIFTAVNIKKQSICEGSDVDYFIIPLNTHKESLFFASNLRGQGYNVEVEMSNRKLSKALDRANKEKVRNIVVIGEEEVINNKVTVRDMLTGEERTESFMFRD
jgi:histidyl-tRNA synthetase